MPSQFSIFDLEILRRRNEVWEPRGEIDGIRELENVAHEGT